MKKIIALILTLLVLVGCSNKAGYASVNNDDVLFYNDKVSFKANDLFTILKSTSSSVVVQDLISDICELENIDTDGLETEAQEYLDELLSYGEYFESYIISYYGSTENFKNLYKLSLMEGKVFENGVKENIATYAAQDYPVQYQLASFDTIEAAQNVLNEVAAGTSYDMAVLNNGYEGDASPVIYTIDDESLNTDVKGYLNLSTNVGISTIITSASTSTDDNGNEVDTNTYYVLNVISRDYNEFLDDYVTDVVAGLDEEETLNKIFAKHNIEFYDQDIYDLMIADYDSFKVIK